MPDYTPLRQAKIEIVINIQIGKIWHKYFRTMDEAAQSWINYKNRNSPTTREEWIYSIDPDKFKRPDIPIRF